MLSEDHLVAASNHIQHHDHHDSIEDESKAVARELLTSKTDIFVVGPPSVFGDIVEDIMTGKDQPHSSSPQSASPYYEGPKNENKNDLGNFLYDSTYIPSFRRKDSIMAPEQVTVQIAEQKQVAADEHQTAAQRVFGTYELLERILLGLTSPMKESGIRENLRSLKTTLLAQRVNKTFSHVIQRSTRLQEKLFFKHKASMRADPDHIAWNPFLGHPAARIGWEFHGALYHSGFIQIEPEGPEMGEYLSLPSSSCGLSGDRSGGTTLESWRRMLVCQGEPLDLQLYVNPTAPAGEAWWCDRLVAGTNTTMGQIWGRICVQREWTLQ